MTSTNMPNRNPSVARFSLFQSVNAFIGHHVECTDIGEDLSYHVALSDEAGQCVVSVRCICGAQASFPARQEHVRALITVTRRLRIPTTGNTLSDRASEVA